MTPLSWFLTGAVAGVLVRPLWLLVTQMVYYASWSHVPTSRERTKMIIDEESRRRR